MAVLALVLPAAHKTSVGKCPDFLPLTIPGPHGSDAHLVYGLATILDQAFRNPHSTLLKRPVTHKVEFRTRVVTAHTQMSPLLLWQQTTTRSVRLRLHLLC